MVDYLSPQTITDVVADGISAVRGVKPSSVFRLHNVAVYTRFRVIRQIGVCFGEVEDIPCKPYQNTYQ